MDVLRIKRPSHPQNVAVTIFLFDYEEGGGVRQQREEVGVLAEAKSAVVTTGVGRLVEFHRQGSYFREGRSSMGNLTFGLADVVMTLLEGGEHEVVDLFEEGLLVLAADGDVVVVEVELDWMEGGVRWTWLVPRVKVVRMGLRGAVERGMVRRGPERRAARGASQIIIISLCI